MDQTWKGGFEQTNFYRGSDWRPDNTANIEIDFFNLCSRGYHILHELKEMPLTPPNSYMVLEDIPMKPDFLWQRHKLILQFNGPVHRHLIIARRDKQVREIQERHGYTVESIEYSSYSSKFLREVYGEVKEKINGLEVEKR